VARSAPSLSQRVTATISPLRRLQVLGTLQNQALEFVELWEHRRKTASETSGGMQRRLQLAAAVVHEPELLFVDEPTANLDPILRRRFWEAFASLRDAGRTLFVTVG
jgi:ABC-type multidrug transport system ATPase subunit